MEQVFNFFGFLDLLVGGRF